MKNKSQSLNRLSSLLPASESSNSPVSGLEILCKIFLETTDPVKRERAVRKFIKQRGDFNALIENNFAMLITETEQALLKMSVGYEVTEKTIKTTSRGRFIEERTRYIPSNQKAAEFILTNIKPKKYSASPKLEENNEGLIEELMEAFKNVR